MITSNQAIIPQFICPKWQTKFLGKIAGSSKIPVNRHVQNPETELLPPLVRACLAGRLREAEHGLASGAGPFGLLGARPSGVLSLAAAARAVDIAVNIATRQWRTGTTGPRRFYARREGRDGRVSDARASAA
jgi:hypothetical protein